MIKYLFFILFFILSTNVNATQWFVRDGGGNYGTDSTHCNGQTNVAYVAGQGPNCAVNHPRWIIGWDDDNPQTQHLLGGDTLSISGDSDVTPGAQATYLIGFDDSGANTTPTCSSSFPYDCNLTNLPAGTDAGHPTIVIGTGTHQPQLWGNERVQEVLKLNHNYITIQNLEITDHSTCSYNDIVNGCNRSSYPYGAQADDGIVMSGDGITLTNLYIHGISIYGVITGQMASATMTNVKVIGNGYGGFIVGNDGNESVTGTLTFNQPIIDWNGCQEAYPVTGGIENPSNYTNCFGQNSGGYGDGLPFGATGSQNAGNWNIIGPGSISFNTQDGLDTLHGNASGTIQIDKMRFEGNGGDQIKANSSNFNLTNSVIIGDCGWWLGAAQSVAGGMANGDTCRANGDVIVFQTNIGSVHQINNNTIMSNGNIVMGYNSSDGCDSTTHINFNNNIVFGGYVWGDSTGINGSGGNTLTTFIFPENATCAGSVWSEDYNIVYNTKNSNSGCNGAHDKCQTSPGFVSTMVMGVSGGAANTFYQGQSGVTYAPIATNSAAKAAGNTGYSYWNTINDYYNNSRPSISMGALEYNSLAANAFSPCFFNSDCSSNICTANVCSSSGGGSGGTSTRMTYSNLTFKNLTLK